MNDTRENEICEQAMNQVESSILKYLCDELKLEQFTDPQLKQFIYEDSKKKQIFSLRSLDSDTETQDSLSCSSSNRCSLQLTRSPLILKRLSVPITEQI
ncbi:unnamed protein product (macronuclear) [Paramecium tetraurelia]|uniref:Uncharacterized protein n=1 Tax=Paramecium tetraurelia TaxID=5888 RepID=A0CWP9_PARTE|nr:uncharacterized protein GSPATT00001419001 [Paramecium tetraurelia]CAK75216.1 unnamed protein product [Paramecium tetraurelia]|eukprot:XP_001442613.1 hypothetical protein (macronuclear) [Paramecium tetraurelia strain d4-2]